MTVNFSVLQKYYLPLLQTTNQVDTSASNLFENIVVIVWQAQFWVKMATVSTLERN